MTTDVPPKRELSAASIQALRIVAAIVSLVWLLGFAFGLALGATDPEPTATGPAYFVDQVLRALVVAAVFMVPVGLVVILPIEVFTRGVERRRRLVYTMVGGVVGAVVGFFMAETLLGVIAGAALGFTTLILTNLLARHRRILLVVALALVGALGAALATT